jgi:hypothetical protein
MLKRSALLFVLLSSLTSFTSMASLITVTQVQSYTGTAGDASVSANNLGSSVDAFEFLKFDTSLGELTSVNLSYRLSISGGSIGVQNNSNGAVSGTGTLGATVELASDLEFKLLGSSGFPEDMFELFESSENFNFSLAANGDSGDSQTFTGLPSTEDTGFVTALDSFMSLDYLTQFKTASAETFAISFDTLSVFSITVPSSSGTFSPVLIDIETSLNYGYTAAPAPPVGVPEPAVFAFGLLMLCAVTGRKFIK